MDSSITLSMPGLILLVVAFLGMGGAVTWLLLRSKLAQSHADCADREADLRETQKSIHEKERAFLDERNKLEIAHAESLKHAKAEAYEQGRELGRVEGNKAHLESVHEKERAFLDERNKLETAHTESLKQAKSEAYEQGREFGKVEGNKAHLEEIMALKSEFSAKLASEVDSAVSEARKRLTAEYELQTKLFTVQISPFVRISDNKGLFSSESEVETGYQYQLLVNGIPAFQPHSIVERSEVRKEVNEENVRELVSLATDFASGAISTYLGAGGGKFAKLAPAIVKKLAKK